jgi:hypothetical protein
MSISASVRRGYCALTAFMLYLAQNARSRYGERWQSESYWELFQEATMDLRRLEFGLAALVIVAGILLALFTPGEPLNRGVVQTVETPFGSLSVSETKALPWAIVGYVLIGLGCVEVVVGFAMKTVTSQVTAPCQIGVSGRPADQTP